MLTIVVVVASQTVVVGMPIVVVVASQTVVVGMPIVVVGAEVVVDGSVSVIELVVDEPIKVVVDASSPSEKPPPPPLTAVPAAC